MTTNQTIDGVPRKYVMHLTDEAHSVLLGMVEHCLNVRACMGMDEGFKDFDTEEEHDFVKELRALLDAERCTSCDGSGDLIDLTGEWRGYCVCPAGVALKNKPATQPQGEPVEYQSRTRPLWRAEDGERAWFPWEKCSAESFANYQKNPLINDWQYEVRALYAGQPAPVAVVPEQTYRLLGDGDVIMDGDETLNDDTATWGKVPMGVFIGMPYNRRVMLPVRRAKP